MNLMLLIFIVLWLGYINHDFDFKFFIIRDLYFFYYQNIPMKYLLKRMFLIGCGLLVAFVWGSYRLMFMAWTICRSFGCFSSRFVLRLFHISKPGGLFCDAFCHGNEHAAANRSITDRLIYFMGVVLPWLRQWLQNYWIHGLSRQLKSNFKERFHEEPLVIIDSVSTALPYFFPFMSVTAWICIILIGWPCHVHRFC